MYRIFASIFLFGCLSLAAGREGAVFSSDGEPLAYAIIQHPESGQWTVSSENGTFRLTAAFTAGDSVIISRYGYQTETLRLTAAPSITIVLSSTNIPLSAVTRYGNTNTPSRPGELITITKTADQGHVEYSQLLKGIPGLTLRSYGGPASIKTISMDGGPASHTRIVIDDFDISNIQNGETDLSQLPLPFIEKIRFYPVTDNTSGGSADGTIALDPWSRGQQIQYSRGSFGHQGFHLTSAVGGPRWRLAMLAGQRQDEGNYDVKWRSQVYERSNNHFRQSFAALNSRLLLSQQLFLKVLALYSEQDRGVAGLVYSPSSAERQDAIFFSGATLGWIHGAGLGHLRLSTRLSRDHYSDETYRVDSRHELETYSTAFDHQHKINSNLAIRAGVSGDLNRMASNEAGRKGRTTVVSSLGIDWQAMPGISINPLLRYYSISGLKNEPVAQLSLSWDPDYINWLNISVNGGNSVRYPTFNELFWKPGGNPELKPEHTVSQTAVAELVFQRLGRFNLQLFVRESDDLIHWLPQGAYWSPRNIKQVRRSGWHFTWSWNWTSLPVEGFLSLGNARARLMENGANYNKQLRYTPEHSAALSMAWSPGDFSFRWQIQYNAEMISLYNWPADLILPALTLQQLSASYRFRKFDGHIYTVAAIENLTNEYYETVLGYPEAGRTFRLTFTYER